jgi:hypothetical protein
MSASFYQNNHGPFPLSARDTLLLVCNRRYVYFVLGRIVIQYHHADITQTNIHKAVKVYMNNPLLAALRWGFIWDWDVSRVTNMAQLFLDNQINPDLSRWDVSRVTDMSHIFILTNLSRLFP